MSVVFEQVLILLIFAAVGYTLCKSGLVSGDKTSLLSTLEVYIFLPCVIFNTFSQRFTVDYLREKYVLLIASTVLLILLIIGARFVAHWMTKDSYQRLVYRYSLTVPNYGYVGYALAESIFGSATLLDVMIFVLPISVYTYSIGYAMLTNCTDRKKIVKKIINPPIIATLLGSVVGLTGFVLPGVLQTVVEKAGACMSPVSMLLIGMVVSQYDLKSLLTHKHAYIICAMRLVVIPVLVHLLLKITSMEMVMTAAVLIYCMPCGANTIVFAKMTGQDCRTGASLSLISTVLSVITIPLCVYFLIG